MDFLDLTLPTIEANLALDELLLLEAEEVNKPPRLRLWELPTYAVVLGASGRIHEDVILDQCVSEGVSVARRSSGGGTVVIGPGALNFTVVLPRDFEPGLEAVDRAQSYVLERVAQAISRGGPAIVVAGSGDLVVASRKVSGSAQRRLKHHFLVHASILYDFDLPRIWRYTRMPARQPDYRQGRDHADFVSNLSVTREQLVRSLRDAWDASANSIDLSPESRDRVRTLVAEKFGLVEWVHRL